MLSGNDSIATYKPSNIFIWVILAFQGGLINLGGYLACHQFVSHVTGFATLFGLELESQHFETATAYLVVPLFFLMGSFFSGLLTDTKIQMHKKPNYILVLLILLSMMLIVAVLGHFNFFGTFGAYQHNRHSFLLLAVLCLACGLQNGMIAMASNSVVRTTHMTGITTDLGIGLARLLKLRKTSFENQNEVIANAMRVFIIIGFGMGSIVGAYIFSHFGFSGFYFPGVFYCLLLLAMIYFRTVRK